MEASLDIPNAEELKIQIEHKHKQNEQVENEQRLKIEAVFGKRDPMQKWMTLILNQPLLPHFQHGLERKGYSVVGDTVCHRDSYAYLI